VGEGVEGDRGRGVLSLVNELPDAALETTLLISSGMHFRGGLLTPSTYTALTNDIYLLERMDTTLHSPTSHPRSVPLQKHNLLPINVSSTQVLFDILPLRLVTFGGIVYGLVRLVPAVLGLWKFMLTLVMFSLTTTSVVL
jgi:hypothetical protein